MSRVGGDYLRKIIPILIVIVIVIVIAVFGIKNSDYREKKLTETLEVNPRNITSVTLSSTGSKGQYRSTTDKDKIDSLIHYLNQVDYERLPDDQASYMPMKASIIYLYENDKVDFIVPYETGAMISHKVYQIKKGKIENTFLIEFYQLLD